MYGICIPLAMLLPLMELCPFAGTSLYSVVDRSFKYWALRLLQSRSCRFVCGDVRRRSRLPVGRGGLPAVVPFPLLATDGILFGETSVGKAFLTEVGNDRGSDLFSERTQVKSSSQHVESSVFLSVRTWVYCKVMIISFDTHIWMSSYRAFLSHKTYSYEFQ